MLALLLFVSLSVLPTTRTEYCYGTKCHDPASDNYIDCDQRYYYCTHEGQCTTSGTDRDRDYFWCEGNCTTDAVTGQAGCRSQAGDGGDVPFLIIVLVILFFGGGLLGLSFCSCCLVPYLVGGQNQLSRQVDMKGQATLMETYTTPEGYTIIRSKVRPNP